MQLQVNRNKFNDFTTEEYKVFEKLIEIAFDAGKINIESGTMTPLFLLERKDVHISSGILSGYKVIIKDGSTI